MRALPDWWIACLVVALAACSPALDWREVRVDTEGLVAVFPCRPKRQERGITLVARSLRMAMASCEDAGITYAAGWIDLDDPTAVTSALEALQRAAVVNLGSATPTVSTFALRGMTPNPAAARIAVAGRLPDGRAVQEHAAFFVHGLRVYQASLIGAAPSPAAVDGFFAGLAFNP